MQRSVSYIVLGLILAAGGGFQVFVHTCGGVSTVEAMPLSAKDPCGCHDEDPADRCCTTELHTLSIDDSIRPAVSLPGGMHQAGLVAPLSHEFQRGRACPPEFLRIPSQGSSSVPITILSCNLRV